MLTSMLDDKDVEVRLATVAGLAEWKGKSGLDALHRAMNDPAPEVGFAAAKALWSRHDPAGRETLAAVLSGEMRTASGFLTVQKREAFHMMHTPKAMFLFAVEQGMGFVPLPGFGEGVASMQGLLADTGVSGRATAALLLGNDRGADTQAALIDALTDKEWQVRAAAIHSLALRNDPAMLDHLLPLLEDHKEAVRLRAAAACIRLEMVQAGNAPGKAKRRYRKAS
jgi:HEAT repeat protein